MEPSHIIKIEEIRSLTRVPVNREKYFDGPEADFHLMEKKIFLVNRHSLKIKAANFEHSFKDLKGQLDAKLFDHLVSEGKFKESALLQIFKSPEDHHVHYWYTATPDHNYLILASFGEVQPTRFQFFLEGVWKVD